MTTCFKYISLNTIVHNYLLRKMLFYQNGFSIAAMYFWRRNSLLPPGKEYFSGAISSKKRSTKEFYLKNGMWQNTTNIGYYI